MEYIIALIAALVGVILYGKKRLDKAEAGKASAEAANATAKLDGKIEAVEEQKAEARHELEQLKPEEAKPLTDAQTVEFWENELKKK